MNRITDGKSLLILLMLSILSKQSPDRGFRAFLIFAFCLCGGPESSA
jgi:hypothetical protein